MRTSEVHHAVDYANANGDLDRLRVDVTRPETVAVERFEPIYRILSKRSPVVATALLPCSTSVTDNCINRAVTLRRTGAYPLANERHPRVAESKGLHCVQHNGRMAWLGVVGTGAADIDLLVARNLVEALGQSVTVSHILMRHQCGMHLTRIALSAR
ncbi:MAG: hypothetical protein E5299_01067 [Burkholderia gladioli]|nr:MAG: hypothetical protein E5299_01067 [Burkholderia gladioli]